MIRFLILAGLLCLAAGCGGSDEYAEPVQPDEAEKIVVTFSQGDDPDNLQEVSRTEIDLKTGGRRELQTQTAERRKNDPPPQLGGYSPDENGTAAYLRDLDAWEKRNPVK